jgi:hypothetical protein
MKAKGRSTVDLYKASLLWSRRFMGLKVFMTLAELGSEGIAALIDRQAAMGNGVGTKTCFGLVSPAIGRKPVTWQRSWSTPRGQLSDDGHYERERQVELVER